MITRRLQFEPLETRRLLTTIGTWTSLASTNPGAQVALLEPDGSVMYQVGNNNDTTTWSRLAPNASGSYANGTTSALASMNVGRLFFGSAVLPNGQTWVIGGEYSTQASFANTAEIFSPTAGSGGSGTWTNTAAFPQTQFGDDPVEVLSGTQVLAGDISNASTYLYNPTTNTWTQTGTKLRSDESDEETWIKLPDGSILSYDVFSSASSGVFHAQRYIPSTGTWVDASNLSTANPPHILSTSSVGYELGPGLLLPNGNVFLEGGNGYTAYYNPATNLWSAGPMLPTSGGKQLVAADAPAAMMANGDVLMALSPLGRIRGGAYTFPSPTYLYEFNPNDGSYTYANLQFTDSGDNSFLYCMLDLPNGQVLVTNETTTMELYTPSFNGITIPASWQPTLTGVASNGGGVYTLTGTQFNGISEGASYGDDNTMASNYPIVQFTDSSGNIYYGRTSNWSSVGVATGSAPVTTQVTLPSGHTVITDFASMEVIANGIASPSYAIATPTVTSLSTSQGKTAGGTTLAINGTNLATVTSVNFGSAPAMILSSSATQLVVTSPAGAAGTVDVTATGWFGTSATGPADRFTYLAPPIVTAANIMISGATGAGGAYRAGDTVTATWNNTASGDNNTSTIASVSVDFSQFGGPSAVAASNNGNIWTASYTIPSTAMAGSNLNVVVTATDNAGNATTTAGNANARIAVPPSLTASPNAVTVNVGNTASFSASAGGDPTPTVQWQVSTNGTSWNPAPGTNNQPTYSFTASAAENGDVYEAVFTNAAGTATTSSATLTVDYIATQPLSQTVNDGQAVSFSAASSNPGGADTVQWEVSTNGGTSFSQIPGAISTTYAFTASVADNNYQYLAVFSNTDGTLPTAPATLTVVPVPIVGVWNSTTEGVWNSAVNWTDSQGSGVPGSSGLAGDMAAFNGAAGLNVDLGDFSPKVAGLTFGPSQANYSITSTGSGQLQLSNSGSNAEITVAAGSQTISAAVELASSVVVSPAAGSKLTISGRVTGEGESLSVNGPGTVILHGPGNYTGGTIVSAGELIVQNPASIASGTGLIVGADAALLFEKSAAASAPAATLTLGPAISDLVKATSAPKRLAALSLPESVPTRSAIVATADRAGATAIADRIAANAVWWAEASDASDATVRHQNRAESIKYLDAVFAEYGG